ncbi:unnamed protein product [Cylindrotheca closterium]|uniref:Uncharacterized protein n=1 Tax=Cylindrotheca closterium TaxID=2856 RepID=A0AAD2FV81_9STRA|nr:unnamed protein product [Cylindrotheca closterium]
MKSTTVGEELFLVHLRRNEGQEAAEEQRDILPELREARKRSASLIGEELWQVHLKRSRGEVDLDLPSSPLQNENHDDTNNTMVVGRYNLRRRTPKK